MQSFKTQTFSAPLVIYFQREKRCCCSSTGKSSNFVSHGRHKKWQITLAALSAKKSPRNLRNPHMPVRERLKIYGTCVYVYIYLFYIHLWSRVQCIHTPGERERGRKTPQFSHPSSWNWSDTFLRIFTNIFIPFPIAALRKESLSGKRCATGILTTTLLAIRAMAMQITTKWKSLYEGDFFL